MGKQFLVWLLTIVFLAGCTGGPGLVPRLARPTAKVAVTLKIPALATQNLHTKYISASTRSFSITPNSDEPTVVNIVSGQSTYTVTLTVPVGQDSFTARLYDAADAGGTLLATGTTTATMVAGQTNTVNITIEGVINRIVLTLATTSPPKGSSTSIPLTVLAKDAGGNIITGTYASPITLTTSDTSGSVGLSRTSVPDSTTPVTISYDGVSVTSTTISASADGVLPGNVVVATLTPGYSATASLVAPFTNLTNGFPNPSRKGATSVLVGNKYIYLIGGSDVYTGNATTYLNSVERATILADGTLGPFAVVPDVTLVAAREKHSSIVIGNYLYVIGGYNGTDYLSSVERATINADGTLGTFATVSGVGLIAARQIHSNIVVGNNLYVIGGFDGSTVIKTVESAPINADGTIGTFATVAGVTLGIARMGHSNVIVGNFLYVIGGWDSTNFSNLVEQAPINADGTIGNFAVLGGLTLNTGRVYHASIVLGNNVYVLGGYTLGALSNNLNSVERATIDNDGNFTPFVDAGVTLTRALGRCFAMQSGNFLYLFGNTSNPGDKATAGINDVQRAAINADNTLGAFSSSVSGSTLAIARWRHASVVIGKYLYVIGGSNYTVSPSFVSSSIPQTSVERATINADGTLGAFALVPGVNLVTARDLHTVAVIGNYLYVIGGINANTNAAFNSIERATINGDGTIGTFVTVSGSNLVSARGGHTSVVLGNNLYVVGGASGNTILNSVEVATINANGTLGPFGTLSANALLTGRTYHSSAAVGNYLYVLGGMSGSIATPGYESSVERAPINADKSLGAFASVPDYPLATSRIYHTSSAVGDYLYTIGGRNASGRLNGVEAATVNSDGTISAAPGLTLNIGRTGHTSTVIGPYVYVIGGFNSESMGIVERAAIQ